MAVESQDINVRQRARNDRSGKSAAGAIYCGGLPDPDPQPVRRVIKNPRKDNYSSPSEFYAGPAKPGKLNFRRNEAAGKDSVAFLLTDVGLMTAADGTSRARVGKNGRGRPGAAAEPPKRGPKVPLAERNNVDHSCFPTAADPAWRSGVKITRPAEPMDAPYFEEMAPKPSREVPVNTGKRRMKGVQQKHTEFIDPSKPLTAEEALAIRSVPSYKTNRANMSVNVLRLSTYTPKQLNEPTPAHRPVGPRRWTAPDMPPPPKPAFASVKSQAKDEHDVLGTGRWGVREEEKARGVARGTCRPKRDSANLFAGDLAAAKRRNWLPPDEIPKVSALHKKHGGQANLLKYYDPNVDGDMKQPPQKPHGNRANEESKLTGDPNAYRFARGQGIYAKNGQCSTKSLW